MVRGERREERGKRKEERGKMKVRLLRNIYYGILE